ncbi:MAG: DUF493 family protein [Bdellovibrionales bacterium]
MLIKGMDNFKQLLEDKHEFPGPYTFKFVVKSEKLDELLAIVPMEKCDFKKSRNGKYTSVSYTDTMPTSDSVVDLYERVKSQIPDIIGL